MKIILGLLVLAAIVGSPVWISLAILNVPRRWWFVDALLCGLQMLIAGAWWWFWWGGGIGCEAHASSAGQWVCLLAVLPIAVAAMKYGTTTRRDEGRGFPVVGRTDRGSSPRDPRV